MPRLLPLGLATAVATLLLAPAAHALIQIDEGIAGARLGNSRAEVRAALGAPDSTRSGSNDFGRYVEYRFDGGLLVRFQGRTEVTSVETTGRGDRTTRGVGVGSSERSVRASVPGVTCETIAGFRSCHTNELAAGQTVTDFVIRSARVSSVRVAIVID